MRFALSSVLACLLLLVTRTAAAEPSHESTWAAPVVSMALLDGFRAPSAQGTALTLTPHSRDARTNEDPGEALTAAVERMWSQVRAYRRPGGAELIVRGRF